MKTYNIKPDMKSADVQAELDKTHGPGTAKIAHIDWGSGTAYYELTPPALPRASKS